MGILNVTPDSFSDGGQYLTVDTAVARALQLEEYGAAVIDIGGESTKPGVAPTSLTQECQRVLPVVEALKKRLTIPLSIDTSKAEVAKRALDAGASMINDVTALRGDPEMASVVAGSGAKIILMHMQGTPRDMQSAPSYTSLFSEISEFFSMQIAFATHEGITIDQILLDPGIGFGKTPTHNLMILKQLDSFHALGLPLVIGPSRKSFLGHVLDRPVGQRLMGTAAAVTIAAFHGVAMVRVHDVAEMAQVVRVAQAIRDAGVEEQTRAPTSWQDHTHTTTTAATRGTI